MDFNFFKPKFPFYAQHDRMDCGPVCLKMISKYYGKSLIIENIRELCFLSRTGVNLTNLERAAKTIGFDTHSVKVTFKQLVDICPLPCIIHWKQDHFVVLTERKKGTFIIADPGHGMVGIDQDEFLKYWLDSKEEKGIALLLTPNNTFYAENEHEEQKIHISYLITHIAPHKKKILHLFLLLLLSSMFNLILPFLTEALIDKGVNPKRLNFIFIVLLAQLAVFIGSAIVQIFRNWITLVTGSLLSISIISDFLKKLLYLPIKFFDTKILGDFNQRINDNEKIEEFLTSQSLLTFFSIITFSVFLGILGYYDLLILSIYVTITTISIFWSIFWLKKRKDIDYFRFNTKSENQELIYEIINGVTEIKLNQLEELKRLEWESTQKKLFKINIRILKLDQIQSSGFDFLNQVKNIVVTFLAAKYVVQNVMSLGELLSISYIIGQMNYPINQLITFFRSYQDARLSLERLNEVENHQSEESKHYVNINCNSEKGIELIDLNFQYKGPQSPFVLKNINAVIPQGKVTAIVGASGSGKTTLMKLLLRFYDPTGGQIYYGEHDILALSPKSIRENTGVVMQDGHIFSDTIERNIATGDRNIDPELLRRAAQIANIESFIESLPLRYNTKIGSTGSGLSGGQKQRILIARAVYKNPKYIFFDEATSALDSENEKIIHENLQSFFKGKTVIIIAHRLSTVKNADHIIVMKDGSIIEYGSHNNLVTKKANYYNLVKNQLELGT